MLARERMLPRIAIVGLKALARCTMAEVFVARTLLKEVVLPRTLPIQRTPIEPMPTVWILVVPNPFRRGYLLLKLSLHQGINPKLEGFQSLPVSAIKTMLFFPCLEGNRPHFLKTGRKGPFYCRHLFFSSRSLFGKG